MSYSIVDPTGTHQRYFKLIIDHGSDAEKRKVFEAMQQMQQLRLAFEDGSGWDPLETVTLPGFLVRRCERVAHERQGRARRFDLEDKEGVQRSLEEETRSTEAQYAACLMLNLPFEQARTHMSGKAGNIGPSMSVNCPRPGNFGLTIRKGKPPTMNFFLVYQDSDHTYTMQGWVRAGEVMLPQFEKDIWRNGKHSRPWVVPARHLRPLKEWFER